MTSLILGPIIGGLSHEGANLWARADGPGRLRAWIATRPDLSDARLAAESYDFDKSTSFAGVAPVRGLQPDTVYRYALTLQATPPPPDAYRSFTTAPAPGTARSFRFAFGSCFLPDGENGGMTFKKLGEQKEELSFALLIGDQIYADAAKTQNSGLDRIALTREDYNAVYTYVWKNKRFRDLLADLPAFMTLDDHEVDDDWRWEDEQHHHAVIPIWNALLRRLSRQPAQACLISLERVRDALQAYWDHQLMHAPPLLRQPPRFTPAGQYDLGPDQHFSLAYAFDFGRTAFFVMDTRSMRVRPECRAHPIMLDEFQWKDLETWLERVRDYPVKFIVTSSACLFQMWSDLPGDRWSLYKEERTRLFRLLAEKNARGIYFLAGDLHSGHAISASLQGQNGESLPLWEFCASPFEQQANWLAPLTYQKVGSPLRDWKKHFIVARHNFGIVDVNLDDPLHPRVRFELNYQSRSNGWEKKEIET